MTDVGGTNALAEQDAQHAAATALSDGLSARGLPVRMQGGESKSRGGAVVKRPPMQRHTGKHIGKKCACTLCSCKLLHCWGAGVLLPWRPRRREGALHTEHHRGYGWVFFFTLVRVVILREAACIPSPDVGLCKSSGSASFILSFSSLLRFLLHLLLLLRRLLRNLLLAYSSDCASVATAARLRERRPGRVRVRGAA